MAWSYDFKIWLDTQCLKGFLCMQIGECFLRVAEGKKKLSKMAGITIFCLRKHFYGFQAFSCSFYMKIYFQKERGLGVHMMYDKPESFKVLYK